MSSPNDQRTASRSRTILTFFVAYLIAVLVLGLVDAASLIVRMGADHRLTTTELALLSIFSLRLTPMVHTVLLAGGALYSTLLMLVPARFERTRVVALCLPLAVLAGIASLAAQQLPLILRTPVLMTGTWVAMAIAPIAIVGVGLYLARADRPCWHRRALLAALALGLAVFTRVFGLTEAVMARIPGTLFSLVALTYLFAWLLRDLRKPARLAGALAAIVLLAGGYVATAPSARRMRAEAIVAHKTQLLQALFFTEIAAFAPSPGLPQCAERPTLAKPSGPAAAYNVLLITLDALRADHMAAYGYDRVTMPNVEALLREAVVFDTAYSATPATAGSFTAMWTGSSAYSMRAFGRWPKTLQERMRELGYRILGSDLTSIASASAPGLPATALTDAPIPRLAKAADLVDTLIEQIRTVRRPFLAFAHFIETHDEGVRRYVPRVFPDRRLARYDDSMFEIDRHVGRLLEALKASGDHDNTVVVFSSDHGEFFGEHAREHHGSLLYEPVVRVPFAIKLPGVVARREATFVSGFDLSPTVFKAATGRAWPLPTLGQDVFAEVAAGRHDRAVFMENVSGKHGVRRVVAVRKGRFKYTRLRGTSIEELFDLERDPGELNNLAGEAPDVLALMRKELDAMLHIQACELRAMRERG